MKWCNWILLFNTNGILHNTVKPVVSKFWSPLFCHLTGLSHLNVFCLWFLFPSDPLSLRGHHLHWKGWVPTFINLYTSEIRFYFSFFYVMQYNKHDLVISIASCRDLIYPLHQQYCRNTPMHHERSHSYPRSLPLLSLQQHNHLNVTQRPQRPCQIWPSAPINLNNSFC